MSNDGRVRRNTKTRGKRPMLDAELKDMPGGPCENQAYGETSTNAGSQERQEDNPTLTTIDLDAYDDDDDDVIISSPRACAQVKNNSRRNHEITIVVDVDREGMSSLRKRTRFSSGQTNHNIVMNLDDSGSYSMRNRSQSPRTSPHPPPQPPTFSCPVCMGTLVEETSTRCGHIFCKACIKASITAQKKYPTCSVENM